VQKRRDFEFLLRRRTARKADFLRYVEHELNLEELRKIRKVRLPCRMPWWCCIFSGVGGAL
jgi:hypothetical protein